MSVCRVRECVRVAALRRITQSTQESEEPAPPTSKKASSRNTPMKKRAKVCDHWVAMNGS
jgi:hypothetical protein